MRGARRNGECSVSFFHLSRIAVGSFHLTASHLILSVLFHLISSHLMSSRWNVLDDLRGSLSRPEHCSSPAWRDTRIQSSNPSEVFGERGSCGIYHKARTSSCLVVKGTIRGNSSPLVLDHLHLDSLTSTHSFAQPASLLSVSRETHIESSPLSKMSARSGLPSLMVGMSRMGLLTAPLDSATPESLPPARSEVRSGSLPVFLDACHTNSMMFSRIDW